jgi:hypothetical protein
MQMNPIDGLHQIFFRRATHMGVGDFAIFATGVF